MSYDHKAFSFDWAGFERELAPLLRTALSSGDPSALAGFVDANLAACRDPYAGGALDAEWQSTLGAGDVQEVGDFALAKFYDPAADHGLANAWSELAETAPPAVRKALLGSPFGPSSDALFDPGRMGAYFQGPDDVKASLATLEAHGAPELSDFVALLKGVVRDAKGLYVTF